MVKNTGENGSKGKKGIYTIEQFMNTESLIGASIAHDDESILYGSDKSGIYNGYSISLITGDERQLTDSVTEAIAPITYFPNDKRFLYESDQGGNEITHLFMHDEEGSSTDLTPGEDEKAHFFGWSQDKQSFFYQSNKRDARYMDLYEMNITTFKSNLLFQNNDGYHITAISPNKEYIALSKPRTSNDSDMYVYTAAEGVKHLSAHEGDVQFTPQAFDEESSFLYYLTDEDSEFLYLKRISLVSNETSVIAKESWDIALARFSPQYKYLLYAINNDGKIEIKVMLYSSGEFIKIADFPDGQISSVTISDSEEKMAFLLNSSTSSANLYVYDFNSEELTCLTATLNPEIDRSDLIESQVIRYESFDGLEIPAIYYEPHLDENEKAPALVLVHGGPGGQSMVGYDPLVQYLVHHGYAVIAVNNRGSSGYGKSFFKAADLKHGEVDLADCIESKKFLIETGKIDKEKIGIIGGSYGGYMVLAALAFEPESFAVGVNIFGVSNWERTLKSIPAWWEAQREVLYKKIGNPYTETEYIRSISPLFHAHHINKPLIVLQGANDPRVLLAESDDIVAAVKENDIPVEYIVFPDEGHGFTKRENRVKGYGGVLQFLNTHLI